VSFNRTDTESALQANWGNSAFLIAQPIRVVLSSLFIVEGYVTSTTVMFNKFTPTMVPVQATVGIQMQAMYMGFGKKETFFTKAFASNEKNIEDKVTSSRTETDALGTLGSDLFKKIENPSNANFVVRPQDFFDKDKGSKDFTVRFLATNSLRDEISNKGSITKVTVTANIEIKYGLPLIFYHHLTFELHHAALIFPLAIFLPWRALKDALFFFIASDSPALGFPAVLAPCSPNLIVFAFPFSFATTI
jgi:hypothetical protein